MNLDFIAANWAAPDKLVAGTTTRHGGVSDGVYASLNLGAHVGDRDEHVAENRRRLVECRQLSQEPFWLTQVHGTQVVNADTTGEPEQPPEGDAVISSGRALGILTADCLPLLLYSTECQEIAALHCGWRSLAGGIVAATIERMKSAPGALLAWLGPAISQSMFEVGDEVRDRFLAGVEGASACFEQNDNKRWQADLYALARLYLGAAGVARISGGGLCTHTDSARFFSYRRDGQTGRMATIIFRQQK